MSSDLGRPPRAAANQSLVAERLREVGSGSGVRETLTIEWRGQQPLHVEVIDMPIDDLYYNPGTHRVRAQRSYDPERDHLLTADPWSPESQEYLHWLLQIKPDRPGEADPAFAELQESMREFGQNDPGLITRDGILVNGNTRRAALKELGRQTIRVGVLPESSTWSDISSVELALQLRKDHRRDYSYINRLLAIEEQLSMGRQLADVAREFRTTEKACEQDVWVLGCIREMIERSAVGGAQLRLVDFESHQETLKELRRRYAKAAGDKEKADLVKESRLAAMLLGFAKTDVRLIEDDFHASFLNGRLPESLRSEPAPAGAVVIPGLGRSVRGASSGVAMARAFTDRVLQARAMETMSEGSQRSEAETAARDVVVLARKTVRDALEPARIRKRKQAAPDRLVDACHDIDQCVTDLVMAGGNRTLDDEAFDEAVLKLRESLAKLAKQAQRSIKEPGDGVLWLVDAVRKES